MRAQCRAVKIEFQLYSKNSSPELNVIHLLKYFRQFLLFFHGIPF